MKRESTIKLLKGIFLVIAVIATIKVKSQICTGSLGDPVVNVTFGAGDGIGRPLPGNITSYTYVGNDCPNDGSYTIINSSFNCFGGWYNITRDHTPNDVNGYMMLVNASFTPSDFYIDTVKSLCGNTTYEFGSWITNVSLLNSCSPNPILPKLVFNIETISGQVLGTFSTGDIGLTASLVWKQYGLFFTTPANTNSVVIRITNSAPGGCGNDIALDDITFRPCGPVIWAVSNNASQTELNICEITATPIILSATVGSGFNNTAIQWQESLNNGLIWTDILGANSINYQFIQTAIGKYQYRVTAAEGSNISISNCRVASNPILVNINGLPITMAANNGSKCAGDAVVLTASGGSLFQWIGPNGFTANTVQETILNSSNIHAGKYVVTVTDSLGCKKDDSTIVVVYAKPVALFSISSTVCENSNISFSNQSVDGGQPIQKWNWDFGDGSLSNLVSPTHIFTKVGTYSVSLLAENDKGCKSNILVKQVAINPLPKPDFILPAICLADPFATFINTSAIADNSETQFVYAWNFGNNNATPGNLNTSVIKSPQHNYTSIGVYPVQLTVTSKDGCVKDTIKSFTINGSQPIAKFTIDSTVNFCSNEMVSLTNGSTVNFGSISKVEIYWDYGNNPIVKITDSTPVPGKKYIHQYSPFGSPLTREIKIRYVVYSGISCVNETTKLIDLKASPVVQFTAMNNVCEDVKPYLITQANEINGLAGTGTFSGTGMSALGLFNPTVATPGNHVIRFTFFGTNNCTAFAEQSINVFQQPIVNAGSDKTMIRGGLITLDATSIGNGLQYEWTPNTNINNNKILRPAISPLLNTTYTLMATSTNGCKATDEVIVTVLKDIYVPSAFSPNDDGVNDVWRIPYLNTHSGTDIKVFNRYGELVYQATGQSIAWDGKYKGNPLPSGSYVWVLHAGALKKLVHGTVMIVR